MKQFFLTLFVVLLSCATLSARSVSPAGLDASTETWAKSYAQVSITAYHPDWSITDQQILGVLEVDPDTTFFYFFMRGNEPLRYDWVLTQEILPQEDLVAYVAARERGDGPVVRAYFQPFEVGPSAGQYPTEEQIERSRCFYEYRYRMDKLARPQEANIAKAIVYPVTQAAGMAIITYFVLNEIDYGASFLDSEVRVLQAYFWEQLGEEIARAWEDVGDITWAWWTDFTATRYAMDEVTITVPVTGYWLSAEASRLAAPEIALGESADLIGRLDMERLVDYGEGPRPPRGQGPTAIYRWLMRAVTATAAGGQVLDEDNAIRQSCVKTYQELWYSQDSDIGQLAVMLKGLLDPGEAPMPLTVAESENYRQLLRDAQFDLNALHRAIGFQAKLNLFDTWLGTLGTKAKVVSRREATSLWQYLNNECAPFVDVAQYYLEGDEAALWRLWEFICDNQERDLEWERPNLDIDLSDNRVVIGGEMADSIKTLLAEFQANGKLLEQGGTARVWITEKYPNLVLKVVEAGATKPELGFQMQDEIARLAQVWVEDGITGIRVPQVYLGFHDAQGRFCILMERVMGEDLADLSDSDMPADFRSHLSGLDPAEFDFVKAELAAFISQMHQAGYFHGDLHLGNVMLVREGEQLVCYVIDFGNSRRRDMISAGLWGWHVGDDTNLLRGVNNALAKISRLVAAGN